MNRTGYNILPPLTSNQKATLLTHIREYRPALLVFVDEAGLASETQDVSPDTHVIFRRYQNGREQFV